MIAQKARGHLDTLGTFEITFGQVEESLPVDVSGIKNKMLVIKDRLNYVLSRASNDSYEPSEIDGAFNQLEATGKEIDNLVAELDTSLKAYQVLIEGEYATWIGRFQDIGLQVEAVEKKGFQQTLPVEERIVCIKEMIDAGEKMVKDALKASEQVYGLVRALYNPVLPEESQAIAFAKKQLSENGNPWIASSYLFAALNNWKKQYTTEISQSIDYLQDAVDVVAGLSDKSESLRPVLGNDFVKIMDVAQRAENLRFSFDKNAITAGNFSKIGEALQALLLIVRDALVILNEELKAKEKSIDNMLPADDYVWEKNAVLQRQMDSATDVLLNPSKYGLSQELANLPKAVSYLTECISTIARYNEQEELFLNYPVAEIAIEEAFKQKPSISPHDLPFEPKFAEAYLRLFRSKRLCDYSFDNVRVALVRLKK
jgi:hypothetical protein